MEEKKEFHDGKIEPRSITDEVRQSYLDYAMSVLWLVLCLMFEMD